MKLTDFLNKLRQTPSTIAFAETMEVIEANYNFTETAFKNGDTYNEAGQNSGSCKLFAFAQINELSKEDTLACFGEYYRKDVLENPTGNDHTNIRNFIKFSWTGIEFNGQALIQK
ncbi:HopJ type III effector protein [Aquimarina agarilytica]|uniref:HopJ type III effector protein n=1 Tax=Aquimarina agarilytica TaxID=1087449 RepID=UPI00028922EB|nr:HopJ type III effector protein [Aquimarina agarilytica]